MASYYRCGTVKSLISASQFWIPCVKTNGGNAVRSVNDSWILNVVESLNVVALINGCYASQSIEKIANAFISQSTIIILAAEHARK